MVNEATPAQQTGYLRIPVSTSLRALDFRSEVTDDGVKEESKPNR